MDKMITIDKESKILNVEKTQHGFSVLLENNTSFFFPNAFCKSPKLNDNVQLICRDNIVIIGFIINDTIYFESNSFYNESFTKISEEMPSKLFNLVIINTR